MSVINKMLRDLDSRQAQGVTAVAATAGEQGPMRGTASVAQAGAQAPTDPRRYLVWLLALGLLVAAILLVQWLGARPPPAVTVASQAAANTPVAAIAAAPPAVVAVPMAPASTPAVGAASADAGLIAPPAPAPAPAAARVAASGSAPVAPSAPAAPRDPAPATLAGRPALVPSSPRASASSGAMPVAALAMPVPAASSPGPAVASKAAASATQAAAAQRNVVGSATDAGTAARSARESSATGGVDPASARQGFAQAALAQAQTLWNSGARQAAIDLLREAVAGAARADPAGADGSLAALVRELSRMELAQGQVAQVLELLTRLEPALASQPELWAIRGNAAQRLARYAESVLAYQSALKLRPDEPRWMLGLAVSMAADGQTAAAAQWAERARDSGPLSADVLAYLRQMGVNLRER